MAKLEIFPIEYIKRITWEEAFDIAKLAWGNAERLHEAARLLYNNGFIEQAYNKLFIACEEYFKARSFDGIANVKRRGESLDEQTLQEFVSKIGRHEWKFSEVFFDAEMNIGNITLKVEDGVDDTEIQDALHKKMQETFDFLNKQFPYSKKNNSLYVGYDKVTKQVNVPQKEINKDIVQNFLQVCFYVQMVCRVDINNQFPSGEVSLYLKWSGKDFTDLIKK